MGAVGADHQIERARRGVLELCGDAVGVLGERRDGVVPDELAAVGDGREQHVSEVTPQDLDLRDDAVAAERVDGHGRAEPAAVVDDGDAALLHAARHDLVEDVHAARDGPPRTAQVDGLAALPRGRRPLDDGDVVAGSM